MTAPRSPLTPDQIAQLQQELERTLTRLERSVQAEGNGRPAEIDQSAVGRLSRIEAIQNQGLTRSLKDRERQRFDDVADALRRLQEGSYGLCTSCHGAIDFERLLVFPETRTCGRCGGGN
ncbi:MAG TPA: hypothetical protein VFI96_02945 [Longimicrobiaceae bacterium]|nr:hypothetical protein [Longimicrobiaceae bacterium]